MGNLGQTKFERLRNHEKNNQSTLLFPAEVKAGLLAMESPSNGDVEGMKNPGLDTDKGSDGLIHRQDCL